MPPDCGKGLRLTRQRHVRINEVEDARAGHTLGFMSKNDLPVLQRLLPIMSGAKRQPRSACASLPLLRWSIPSHARRPVKLLLRRRGLGVRMRVGKAQPVVGARADILRCVADIHAERCRRVDAPARIIEKHTRDGDKISISGRNDSVGLIGPRDHADSHGRQPSPLLYLGSERDLPSRRPARK